MSFKKTTDKVRSCIISNPVTLEFLQRGIATAFTSSTGVDDFKVEYLLESLASKYDGSEGGLTADERRHAGIQKMLKCETRCREINGSDLSPLQGFDAEFVGTVLDGARQTCADILGDFSYEVFSRSRFSGGASTSRPRRIGDPFFKYKANLGVDVTAKAYPYARALVNCTPLWRDCNPTIRIVSGNRVTTVPKNNREDRPIAIEPDLNMALQKSVGDHIRSRLKAIGINLNKQENNQHLAHFGSLTGLLATIDLSSASDTISTSLVKRLIPWDWFAVLDDIRCHEGTLDGETIFWEKFSAMGNGFTFELESLIFYSLVKAAVSYYYSGRRDGSSQVFKESRSGPFAISVYGDDIICPTPAVSEVVYILRHCGFKLNPDKSFVTGPFRESCGKHFYDGVDVTPIYVVGLIDSLYDLTNFLNKFRRWCAVVGGVADPRGYQLWRDLSRRAPKNILGGKTLESNRAVASPGKRKNALQARKFDRKIGGIPSLLRYLQSRFSSDEAGPRTIFYGGKYRQMPDEVDNHSIVMEVDISVFKLIPNTEPCCAIPLFSQEIVD